MQCLIDSIIKNIDKIIKVDDENLRLILQEQFIEPAETVAHIQNMEDFVLDAFEEELEHFTGDLGSSVDIGEFLDSQLPVLFGTDPIVATLTPAFRDFFTETIGELAEAYIQQIDLDLSREVFSVRTTEFIDEWSEELSEILQDTSHRALNRVLTNALESGQGIPQIIEDLENAFDFSRTRARSVAITEVLAAHSAAQQEAFIQSPAVDGKTWRHSGPRGITPRPAHVALDGTTIAVNGLFNVNGSEGRYPRDTNLPVQERIECHCTIVAAVNRDILGLSLEEKQRLQTEAIEEDNDLYEEENS